MAKKEVLIISFFYQPYNTIGAVRVSSFVRYLQEKGYLVHVISAKRKINRNLEIANNENTHYISWPSSDIWVILSKKYPKCKIFWFLLRVFSRFSTISTSSLPEGGIAVWRYLAYKKAKKIIRNNNIKLIYTSTGPPSSAIIGSKLAKKFNIPWIAEFRDLWSSNIYNILSPKREKINLRVEKKIMLDVSHIIAINKNLKQELENKHNKPVSVIYNGYTFENKNKKNKNDKLIISYMGAIYPQKRDPSILFKAIDDLYKSNQISEDELLVQFYGTHPKALQPALSKFSIHNFVKIFDSVSLKEAIEIQKNSDILLLLSWNDKRDQATPGKLFEYIGIRKPILGICYPGEIKEIIDITETGIIINELEKMKEFLLFAVKNYKTNPKLNFEFNETEINKYSRNYQNAKLLDIISKYM